MLTKEDVQVLSERLYDILNQTILEVEILEWLARNRRTESAEGFGYDPRTDREVIKILDDAAKECDAVLSAETKSMTRADLEFLKRRAEGALTDEQARAVLDDKLTALLDEGFEEPEIVKALGAWRQLAEHDEHRSEERKQWDKKLAAILYAAGARLESLLEEAADDLFDDELEDTDEEEQDDIPQTVITTPATIVLSKNPSLLDDGVDFVELTKRLNKTGRNEPCPCNSGKKFKKCCGGAV